MLNIENVLEEHICDISWITLEAQTLECDTALTARTSTVRSNMFTRFSVFSHIFVSFRSQRFNPADAFEDLLFAPR